MKFYFSVSILLLFSSLHGSVNQIQNELSKEVFEVVVPNPLDLQPDWLGYFEVDSLELKEKIDKLKSFLDSLQSQLEVPDENQEAEKRIKEFYSNLDSLVLLKKQVIESPILAWLPKESYTLDEYIKISDAIRNLNLDIEYKDTDLQRLSYSVNGRRQVLHDAYAKYLSLPEQTKEKFLSGLEVMLLGARLLYLEAEAEFAKKLIEIDQSRLTRYKKEKELIDEKLKFDIDLRKVNEERDKLKNELTDLHSELLGIESQSIETSFQKNGGDALRLVNQKLTSILLNEALLKAKLYFLEAKSILHAALTNPEQVIYSESIAPIRAFRKNTLNQLNSWKDTISTEIDLLSQASVKINGETTEAEWTPVYEESLKIALSNRAFLAALSRELFHIKLALELIDQQMVEKNTVFDQIFYYLQNFWQWFTESFGVWLYYSLFDIGGIPINLMGLIKAALIILASIWISYLVRRGLKQFAKGKVTEPALYTFRRVIHYLILFIGILFAFASLGLTMRNMAIVLGAVGIGIGFGLQNIVNNFLCGLAILFGRNVKIGDYVELEAGYFGKITEVNIQNTTLHTFDGVDVLVPNSSLIASNVVNWTKKDPYQRLHVPFGVAYGTDQAKVSQVIFEAALKVPYTIRAKEGVRDPEVWLVEFADSSLNFELVVWVNIFKSRGRKAMTAEYLSKIELALKEHDIHIPFPQRDLHFKTLPNKSIHLGK